MKEVFPGDSVHSLLSVLDVITVRAPWLSPTPPPRDRQWLSPSPLNLIVAIHNPPRSVVAVSKPPKPGHGHPQAPEA